MSLCVVLFKQKTAYEMRISDWSSDVCSSDLAAAVAWRRRNGCTGPPACRHRGRSHAPARRLRALTGLIRDGPGKRRPRQEGPATLLEYRVRAFPSLRPTFAFLGFGARVAHDFDPALDGYDGGSETDRNVPPGGAQPQHKHASETATHNGT